MDATLAAQLFLMRVRRLLAAGMLVWNPRNKRKTLEFMYREDLKVEDAIGIIADLKPGEHAKGPEPDEDGAPGDVMVFYHPYTLQATPGGKILPPMGMPVS